MIVWPCSRGRRAPMVLYLVNRALKPHAIVYTTEKCHHRMALPSISVISSQYNRQMYILSRIIHHDHNRFGALEQHINSK